MSQPSEFGKIRSFLWPIHAHEIKKILPMFFMLFFISFNYTILRDTKDTLVVTGGGAEVIPFLKVWGVVPAAILFMLVYSKLSNILSKTKLFYTTITPFLVFFGLFALVIYPNIDSLHPTTSADALASFLPKGLGGLVACYRNWTYSLFYVLSELWGSAVLSLLFWGFANDITRVTEAKRFYTLFGLGANVALLFSGPTIMYFSNIRSMYATDAEAWGVTLNYLMALVVFAGIATMLIYSWIHKNVLTDPRFYNPDEVKKKKEKPKMSMVDSFKYLLSSKYILCLAAIVMAYGVSINLVEVTWKSQLKMQYPSANDYNAFMGMYSTILGAVTIVMMLFGGSNIIRRFGWTFAALSTPTLLLATGAAFFAFIIFKDSLGGFVAAMGTTPLFMAVMFGMIQNIMSKSAKYSLFDPTKEMAYIPLDQEQKVKGKAAVDVVGARLGKSGGSLAQQGLLLMFGQLSLITPYIGGLLLLIMVGWFAAARSLGKQFGELTTEAQPEKEPATVTAKPATATN